MCAKAHKIILPLIFVSLKFDINHITTTTMIIIIITTTTTTIIIIIIIKEAYKYLGILEAYTIK